MTMRRVPDNPVRGLGRRTRLWHASTLGIDVRRYQQFPDAAGMREECLASRQYVVVKESILPFDGHENVRT